MWRKKDESMRNASTSANDGSHKEHPEKVVSERWSSLKRSFNDNFVRLCGYKVNDVSNFEAFTQYLYRPTDPASLGVARALFGNSICRL